jgi:hypothetical protein
MQPHLDPTLAANGRIIPAPSNPKGYPPYELLKVLSYTNNQILYYLCWGQITDSAAFLKIKKSRDELLQSLGKNSNSSDKSEETLPHQSTLSHNTTRPLTSSVAAAPKTFSALEATNATNSEPDKEIPAISGGKGLRVNKIMVLKQGGGLLNYWT